METREDRADAYKFFFSRNPEYASVRHLWFSLAGIPIPDGGCTHAFVVKIAKMRNGRAAKGD